MQPTSQTLAYLLRHNPQKAGLQLDAQGWCDVSSLEPLYTREALEQLVQADPKGRFAFSQDRTKIRATYGHSVKVQPVGPPQEPPVKLYHGTAAQFQDAIWQQGVLPQRRQFVHLHEDREAARRVGKRHGTPLVYTVGCREMAADGYSFYNAGHGVWLVPAVPVKYLEV